MTNNSLFITDSTGNKFFVKSYLRIVSLVPSLTEVLFTLGLENNIVGVTKYCVSPVHAREKPREVIGGTKNPNIDKIISLKPDLVIVNEEENQLKHYTALIEANIPVFVTFPKNVSEAMQLFYDLQRLFNIGTNEELESLSQLTIKIQKNVSNAFTTSNKTVFCPIWKKPWMTFNNDTFASAIIKFCGGINIFNKNGDRYPEISLEEVVNKNPDLILLPDEPYKFTEGDRNELIEFFKPNSPSVHLIDGTFHWYSINSMLRTLPVLFDLLTG